MRKTRLHSVQVPALALALASSLSLSLSFPLVAGAAEGQRRVRREERYQNRCTLRVVASSTSTRSRRLAFEFSAREVEDLRLDVWLRESQSSEPVEVRVYTPRGDLFKILRASFDQAPPTDQLSSRRVRRGATVLSARLALVGTHITSRALYGKWQAQASFVNVDEPCSPAVAFSIEP